jgi:hypothetical protein
MLRRGGLIYNDQTAGGGLLIVYRGFLTLWHYDLRLRYVHACACLLRE